MNAIARARVMVVWGVLVYLAVIAGYATAQSMSDYQYIVRYLNVSQGTWVDENNDGYGEGLGYDVDQDGSWDAYRFSTFTNGYLNVLVFDTSGNESFSSAKFYADTTGSGRFNVLFLLNASGAYVALDPEEDGYYTELVSLSAAQNPATIPSSGSGEGNFSVGGGQSTRDIFTSNNAMVNAALNAINSGLQRGIADRWNEPACNGSSNGCR